MRVSWEFGCDLVREGGREVWEVDGEVRVFMYFQVSLRNLEKGEGLPRQRRLFRRTCHRMEW